MPDSIESVYHEMIVPPPFALVVTETSQTPMAIGSKHFVYT
jgi:hypothetical protein